MKTVKQMLEDISEDSPFVEKALLYYLWREGVLIVNSVVEEKIRNGMFSGLLGKQEAGELPGPLNPENWAEGKYTPAIKEL